MDRPGLRHSEVSLTYELQAHLTAAINHCVCPVQLYNTASVSGRYERMKASPATSGGIEVQIQINSQLHGTRQECILQYNSHVVVDTKEAHEDVHPVATMSQFL